MASDTPATSPAPQRPALSAASHEAVTGTRRRMRTVTLDADRFIAPLVAHLAALEADVQRNREQVEQSAGMLMALRTENAEWRQQVAEWRANAATLEAQQNSYGRELRAATLAVASARAEALRDGGFGFAGVIPLCDRIDRAMSDAARDVAAPPTGDAE